MPPGLVSLSVASNSLTRLLVLTDLILSVSPGAGCLIFDTRGNDLLFPLPGRADLIAASAANQRSLVLFHDACHTDFAGVMVAGYVAAVGAGVLVLLGITALSLLKKPIATALALLAGKRILRAKFAVNLAALVFHVVSCVTVYTHDGSEQCRLAEQLPYR